MITVKNLSKEYDGKLVINNVNLSIPTGGLTSIVGPNGAGKSTLLAMISRLLPMSSGQITVGHLDVSKDDSSVLARHLAILRQENQIQLRLSVKDVVSFGRYPHSRGRLNIEDKKHIDLALKYLNLEHLADRFLDQLSGGQRQRVFIAMVLCQNTDYVLLDEPLNNLDMKNSADIMKTLRQAADDLNKTIVVVIHDINFAAYYSDLIIGLRNGELICAGSPDELIRPDTLKQLYDHNVSVHELNGKKICMYYE